MPIVWDAGPASVLFDAVFVPGGRQVEALRRQGYAMHFVKEAFTHGKPIGATGEGVELLRAANLDRLQLAGSGEVVESVGVVTVAGPESMADRVKGTVGMREGTGLGGFTRRFLEALAQHRHWAASSRKWCRPDPTRITRSRHHGREPLR